MTRFFSHEPISLRRMSPGVKILVLANVGAAIRWNVKLSITGETIVNSLELSETASDMLEGT